ncbi:MAG TPA: hypothetical protein VF230_14240 [Acidimicrobiales bacterium]
MVAVVTAPDNRRSAATRRRQALDLQDNVVQALATAKLSFEMGDRAKGMAALEASLAAAKTILSDLLDEDPEPVRAGDLRRETPAQID